MKALVLLTTFFYLCTFSNCSPLDNTTLHCTGDCLRADENALMNKVMPLKIREHEECVKQHECPTVAKRESNIPCQNGMAGDYECENVDLLSFVPLKDLGSNGDGNDIWGWTDSETGKEYAIVCVVDGTSFVDVTDTREPKVIAFMRTHKDISSLWRDVKVYKDHAFVVSEARDHGMQVFDLTRLRDIKSDKFILVEPDAHYAELGNVHNIVSNEETGYMYAVGSRTCNSGLHMIDVREPKEPKFAGCFGDDGYVHDAQCVVYQGPDEGFKGREICFCYNEDSLTIVDVQDKQKPKMLSREEYDNSKYTHQGWLNEEQTHLLLNDELDELNGPNPHTRTMIWDVKDLEEPRLTGSFFSEKKAIDHNLYIRGNLAYEANYCAGLRILDVSTMAEGKLEEVGFFDVSPDCDSREFRGAWSSYVYFESGTIIVNSIERGLFVLRYSGGQ